MVAAIGAAAAVGGSLISSSATKKAGAAQADATAAANAETGRQFDRNVELQMPTINAGNAARDRLLYGLGISPTGTSGAGSGAPVLGRDQLRNELLAQYTKTAPGTAGTPGTSTYTPGTPAAADPWANLTQESRRAIAERGDSGATSYGLDSEGTWTPSYGTPGTAATSTVDEAGLNAAIEARLAQQGQAQQQAASTDPEYGKLAQDFQFDTYDAATPYQAATPYTPDKFSYTGQDLYDDPSYQFRLDQGQKAIDRQGAASGRFLSGAQLQASSNYNQGAASQEYQSAYQRALGTFGTNETNRSNAYGTNENNRLNAYNLNETNRFNAFNTNQTNAFNASQANFTNAVNPLLSLAGSATVGAQNLGNAGMQSAQIIGNNLTSQANATGAAGIAGANSINTGVSNAIGGYQQNQLLQGLLRNNSTGVNNNPGSSSYPSGYLTDQYANDR